MRVLRVLTRPNLGGPTRQAIALWHAQRALGLQTLLVTGVVDGDEAMLSPALAGVPELSLAAAVAAGEAASGWLPVPGWRRSPWRGDRAAAASLQAVLASFHPDVLHSHTSKAGFVARPLARAAGVPVLAHTFHGHVLRDYFPAPVAAWLARKERRLALATDLLFAVSGSCADELAAAGVAARERFLVVPPAVPLPPALPSAAAAAELDVRTPSRHLVCVGRLVPIKRVDHFVRLLGNLPDWSGDIVGDGPERPRLAALAQRLAPGRVRFLGARPDISRLLSAYAALVLPSRREGLPLVAVEAFAAGVPVIGYDVPGVRDALACYGETTAAPESAGPVGLQQALLSLDAARAGRLATAGRRAASGFAPEAVAATLCHHYMSARTRYHSEPRA